MQTIKSLFNTLVDTLFPQICAGCGMHGTLLCVRCIDSIPRADQSVHSFITATFDYQNKIIRHAIWRFKYRNARGYAKHFGERLHEEIMGDLGDGLHISKDKTFLLVPVPLHKKRFRERGYNQSELIVRAIINTETAHTFEYSPNALVRVRDTKPQAKSEKRAVRLENLRGAFHADPAYVRGKDCILVDDVATTGATLSEARKALLRASARSVRAYAVAH